MTSTLSSLEISPKERARKRAEYEVKFKIKSAFVAKDIPRLHDLLKENYWALNQSFDENNQTLLMLAAKMPNDAGYPLAQYLLNLGADWTQRMSPPTELTAQDLARTSGSQQDGATIYRRLRWRPPLLDAFGLWFYTRDFRGASG
jgi:hypothetical protein